MPRRHETDEFGRAIPGRWWTPERLGIVAVVAVVVIGIGSLVGFKTVGLPKAAASDTVSTVQGQLEKSYYQAIDWQDCGGGYFCADVLAPLDWSKSTGKPISLDLIKHPASGPSKGTILVNPGGPGGSGVDMVGSDVTNAVDSTLAKHYDVIGFDPRGVGQSTAVRCYSAKQMDSFLYGILPGKIGSSTWLAASRQNDKKFADSCAQKTGALLSHVDTTSVARDIDLIRNDIGVNKIDYVGYSYGTYLGTIYAGLFPQHVGRFVLDGADDPWVGSGDDDSGDGSGAGSGSDAGSDGSTADGGDDGDVAQAKGFEDDLRAYVAACLAGSKDAYKSGACPFDGTTADGMNEVKNLLNGVAEAPLLAKDGRRLGDATLATGITDALYDTSEWPDLTTAFREVQAGDPAEAFALADEYNDRSSKGHYYDNTTEAFDAVTCLEDGGGDTTKSLQEDAARLKAAAPVLGIYNAYANLLCDEWPTTTVAFPDPVTAPSAGPILVVGSTGDPATPYSDAVALAKQLQTAHLLTRVGEGHTAYDLGDGCINSAVDSFVLDGTVPTGSAARCH